MTRKILLAPLFGLMLALSACQTDSLSSVGTKEGVGTVGGAALGGLLGNQFGGGSGKTIATVAGVLLGGWAGNSIGVSLDRADQTYMGRAQSQAYSAPVGQQIVWSNPQNGNSGTIVPTRDGHDASTGAYCREYQTTVTVGGKKQAAYGQACQQPDGSWQVVK
ncbi:MAG: RT0821/Lpp0805 family surface protein [Alphaproteobacteria bacterium]